MARSDLSLAASSQYCCRWKLQTSINKTVKKGRFRWIGDKTTYNINLIPHIILCHNIVWSLINLDSANLQHIVVMRFQKRKCVKTQKQCSSSEFEKENNLFPVNVRKAIYLAFTNAGKTRKHNPNVTKKRWCKLVKASNCKALTSIVREGANNPNVIEG